MGSGLGHESPAHSAGRAFAAPVEGVAEELLRRLLAADDTGAAAQAAVDAVRATLDVDISWSGLIDGDALTMAAHSGLRTSRMPSTWRLPLGQGIGGRVAVEGRPMAVRDYRHDPRRAPVMKNLIDEEGMRGALCAPLVHGSDVLGVLYAASRSAHDWTPHEIQVVSEAARAAGSVIGRILRLEETSRRAEESRRAAAETQQALRSIADLAATLVRSDDLTGGLTVLAHHIGMCIEVIDGSSGLVLGRAGAVGPDDPARVDVALDDGAIGCLRVRGERDPSPHENAYLQAAGQVVTLHLLRERAGLRAELKVVAEFLDDLLEGRTEDRRGLSARAALLGVDLREPHYVVCLGVHADDGGGEIPIIERATLDSVERDVLERYPKSVIGPRGGDVVVLVPAGADDATELSRVLEQAVRVRPPDVPDGLAAGVGRLCNGLDDYADSYAEAALALDLARRRRGAGAVLTSRDLGLYGLLVRGSTRQTMQEMVKRALGPLLAADAEGGPEYVKTMYTYMTNDRHLERTATALHVHPNTVRYRLARVQELCKVNLRDPDDRFLLELALRVQVALEQG